MISSFTDLRLSPIWSPIWLVIVSLNATSNTTGLFQSIDETVADFAGTLF